MAHSPEKNAQMVLILFIITAFVILLDFMLPGLDYTEEVEAIKKTRQQYYNAAQNYHYSYGLKTEHFYFPVSEKFASTLEEGHSVRFAVSPIFKKVNSYGAEQGGENGIYSLRLVSGLIVPMLALIILGIKLKYRKLRVPALIMRILVLFDLVYLLS